MLRSTSKEASKLLNQLYLSSSQFMEMVRLYSARLFGDLHEERYLDALRILHFYEASLLSCDPHSKRKVVLSTYFLIRPNYGVIAKYIEVNASLANMSSGRM
jgi:hypothetical protein